jgi:BirA family biotin operon repressor/biotin-[acetyl-CoA-carboxylase] ligase
LGVTRAAIWARIEELRKLGYEIDASPVLGYRLNSAPDVLHADDLLARLGPVRVIGREVRVFEETASTNDVVERMARDGVAEGVVVFAESQTKGRGRLGRNWDSARRKGLWFSVLLRPVCRPQEATQLTVMAATAARRAIQEGTGLPLEVKWPNDLLCDGRKVVGMLTELSAEVDRVKHVVLGMGVDVNHERSDFTPELACVATSLRIASGKFQDRAHLASVLLREMDRDYARLGAGEFAAIADEWEQHCRTIGKRVSVVIGGRAIHGHAESLGDDGALLVRTQYGLLERVIGGDVNLEI